MLIERKEEKKLCDRIHSLLLTQQITEPSTPLAKHITPCTTSPKLPSTSKLPTCNKFKHSACLKEIKELLLGVARNLQKLRIGLEQANHSLSSIFTHFEEFQSSILADSGITVVKKLTNRHLRHLHGDCKKIKIVGQLKDWKQKHTELEALSTRRAFLYDN